MSPSYCTLFPNKVDLVEFRISTNNNNPKFYHLHYSHAYCPKQGIRFFATKIMNPMVVQYLNINYSRRSIGKQFFPLNFFLTSLRWKAILRITNSFFFEILYRRCNVHKYIKCELCSLIFITLSFLRNTKVGNKLLPQFL